MQQRLPAQNHLDRPITEAVALRQLQRVAALARAVDGVTAQDQFQSFPTRQVDAALVDVVSLGMTAIRASASARSSSTPPRWTG